MERAGLKDRRNSTRSTKNDEIRARLTELQAAAAERSVITIAGITERLMAIADAAEDAGEAPGLNVARVALMDIAKLNGLVVEKTENLNRNFDVSWEPLTVDEWKERFTPRQ